ncbi:hypothetical protein PACTADRAFT_2407 [Pachysolen tannophilus NRRL Y-2460]|uniref:Pre-mRNA-splicing factor CWC22 n=1 Tax=Pachysolen tannophilus NRRL Y-2460 TaxID=669874 RepID=A0A1E4TWK1_PACTA|nr:hypothetical protein PACTADRAFT_2407 [Pachysolen tannophilus NRRL Y-2460]
MSDRKVYVPRRKLEEEIKNSSDPEQIQQFKHEELKKKINSLINKVSPENIKQVVVELFQLNLIRGKGLLVKTLMKAQVLSYAYSSTYASLVAIINSKIPEIGELLVTRLILQFRRSFKRNDKTLCKSTLNFLGQLVNQEVSHEILALQIIHLLLGNPTDESVEICCEFIKIVGNFLHEVSATASNGIFDQFRYILQEGFVNKRTQYMVEELFQIRKTDFKNYPIIETKLDLVDEEDRVTHMIGLDDSLKAQDSLNNFEFDENYDENELKYELLKKEILGSDESESDEESVEEEEFEDNSEDQEDTSKKDQKIVIKDMTETNLANYQKTVYLTIMSSMNSDEAVHKLLKLKSFGNNQEDKLVDMIIKCCSQEKTYSKYYGLIGEKLCAVNRKWELLFEQQFKIYYEIIHRFETNQLRNIAKLFGHLLASDKLGWECLEVIHLNEEETNSASRIFVKFLFQELVEELGINSLKERFAEEYILKYTSGIFPNRNAEHLRFSINFFTAIGLGVLTEGMREVLTHLPPEEEERGRSISRSRSASVSSSRSGSSYSGSGSGSYTRSPSYSRSRSGSKSRSVSRSGSYSRSRSRSSSKSPTPQLPPHLLNNDDAEEEEEESQRKKFKRD